MKYLINVLGLCLIIISLGSFQGEHASLLEARGFLPSGGDPFLDSLGIAIFIIGSIRLTHSLGMWSIIKMLYERKI
jgi:hypothetical protein